MTKKTEKDWYVLNKNAIGDYYNDRDGVGTIYYNKETEEYALVMWRYGSPDLQFILKNGKLNENEETK